MKTYILQLEPHDDIISVRDKMGWAKNSRILIVWPENVALSTATLNRRLDLVLLQRHSKRLGAQLGLVSQDSEVRYHAPRLGIPVYKNLRQAQGQHWRLPFRFRKKTTIDPGDFQQAREDAARAGLPERPQTGARPLGILARLAFFSAGVLSLLAIAATLAPSARLVLTPQTQVQDVLMEAFTGPKIDAVSLAGAVPSELVSVEVEGRDTMAVSGTIRLPDRAAEGIAVFTNLTDQAIDIPQGTVVQPAAAPSFRYETLHDTQAPAGPGATIEVPVRSLTLGEEGNLPANSLAAIEGILGTQLGVANPAPISGGSDRTEPAPTAQDRLDLAKRLETSLESTARQEIQDQLSPGDLSIPASLELVETLDETYQPEGTEPADQLTLSQRLKFQARFVRSQDLARLVQTVFDANLAPNYAPIPESLQIESLDEPRPVETGEIVWKLHAIRRVQARISDSQAVQLTLGLQPAQAASRLQNSLPLEEPPHIDLQPKWWPRMPILPFRIDVQDQSLQNLSGPGTGG